MLQGAQLLFRNRPFLNTGPLLHEFAKPRAGSPRSVVGEIRSGCWLKLPPAIIPHATPHSYGAVVRDLTKNSANSEEAVLDQITPVILTYNEENNIARTLDRLRWARDVVVVDSFSTDKTVSLIKSFPGVRLFQRAFDSHAQQWNYAVKETSVATEWILALDADYYLTDEFIREVSQLTPTFEIDGYTAAFRYCILGHPLRGSLYPPVTVFIPQSERALRARRTYATCCNRWVGQGVGISDLA